MPTFLTSRSWTAPVVVAPGDVVQNVGKRSILLCALAEPHVDDSLLIRPGAWYVCLAAMTLRAATHGVGIGRLSVAVGLGEGHGDGMPVPSGTGPALSGGSLSMDGADLLITAPTVTAGDPAPTVAPTLTRDGADVLGEVVAGRIPDAVPGYYVATWTASNGVLPNATASAAYTITTPEIEQITVAEGVVLPTPGVFDGHAIGNVPGYPALADPASYTSTDPQGGVGTIVFQADGTPITADTVLNEGQAIQVVVSGTNGETALTHSLGTVQWSYTVTVDAPTQTIAFTENTAAPDTVPLIFAVTVDAKDYDFNTTLGDYRARPQFAVGYPQLVQPDKEVLEPADTISYDAGPVLKSGTLTFAQNLVRNGQVDPDVTTASYQITEADRGDALKYNVRATDGRGTASATTAQQVEIPAPVVPTGPSLVGAGPEAVTAGGVGNPITLTAHPETQEGDLQVIALAGQGDLPVPTLAGWTQIVAVGSGSNGALSRIIVFHRVAPASQEPVTFEPPNVACGQMFSFRGVSAVSTVAAAQQGTATSTTPISINGGNVAAGSLILSVLGTRRGNIENPPETAQNTSLPDLTLVDDVRTLLGNDASLTTWLGTLPEGETATAPTTTQITNIASLGSVRWSGVQLKMTV